MDYRSGYQFWKRYLPKLSTGGRVGGLGGGWLKGGVEELESTGSYERLCGQRFPPAAFFGSFLVRSQEMNKKQLYAQNFQYVKNHPFALRQTGEAVSEITSPERNRRDGASGDAPA